MSVKAFILSKMRMSHIYQPVVIKTLLLRSGTASRKELAEEILKYDPSQIEYYKSIVDKMVGKVLRNHSIIERKKDVYTLLNYTNLNDIEKKELIDLCDSKIKEYISKRGLNIWRHRRKTREAIPGSIKYEVLKRAKFRCELCGISAEEKPLEVDHIVPKNIGGKDSIINYQALCYSCNAIKRDTDSEDFRQIKYIYEYREQNCIFCNRDLNLIAKNNLAFALYDKYPVTKYHILIIPQRHVIDFFDLTQAEINAIYQLLGSFRGSLTKLDESILGFNIGINNGLLAGQTVNHCHIHLIPRRKNDVLNPVGGVRNILPGKGLYQ